MYIWQQLVVGAENRVHIARVADTSMRVADKRNPDGREKVAEGAGEGRAEGKRH